MNFTAMEFVCFFPVVLVLYRLLPPRWRWAELLAASYFFYGIFNPWTVPLLAGTTLVTWLCAKRIEQSKRPAARKAWLLLAGAVCLGSLGLFKYGSFVAGSVSWLFTGAPVSLSLLLPVGISFYTFQTLSYVIDVYRGSFPCEHHLGYYALFISFFPQLVAGPIERPGNLLPQLHRLSLPTGEDLRQGGWRLARGYFKKVALADQLAPIVDQVYALTQPGGPAIVLVTACFALQIYFDFSAYSEIAIGAARLLGVRLMENFDHPYSAASLREFWRRWHISLTGWFTDYLYIPLGGSRCSALRRWRNLLLVFLASGLWHGAAWHFVLWGAFHGACMVIEDIGRRRGLRLPRSLARAATLAVVGVGWMLFRAQNMTQAAELLTGLFSAWSPAGVSVALQTVGAAGLVQLVLTLLVYWLLPEQWPECRSERTAPVLFYTLLLTGIAWLGLAASGQQSAFLYFQF